MSTLDVTLLHTLWALLLNFQVNKITAKIHDLDIGNDAVKFFLPVSLTMVYHWVDLNCVSGACTRWLACFDDLLLAHNQRLYLLLAACTRNVVVGGAQHRPAGARSRLFAAAGDTAGCGLWLRAAAEL